MNKYIYLPIKYIATWAAITQLTFPCGNVKSERSHMNYDVSRDHVAF